MKILHFIPTYAPAWQFGGPVRSVSTLCEALAIRGHEVTVLTTNAGLKAGEVPADGTETMRNGVRVHYFPQEVGYGIKSPTLETNVEDFVKRHDLIHITAIWQRTGPAACRAAQSAGVPYVISPRGALGPYSWRRGRMKKLAYYLLQERGNLSGAAGFHYTSAMEAAECERFRFGKPACVVPNGLDFAKWSRNEAAGLAWRAANDFSPSAVVLLYAGRLHHKKGLDLLPEALGKSSASNWTMVFVGGDDDGTGQRLAAEFARRGLQGRVRFLPGVGSEALVGVYSGSDLFLLPSFHENFGNAALEAAACGCRVLATSQVGVAEELAALGVGEKLDRDSGTWADAITRNLTMTSPRNPSLERLTNAFGIRTTAERMDEFYRTILKGDC